MWEFEKYGDNIALVTQEGARATYADLNNSVSEIGKVVPERSLVFSFCSNSIGSVAGYVSFIKNKIVPVMLKHDLEVELRSSLLQNYKPEYIYMPADLDMDVAGFEKVYEKYDYVLLKNPEGVKAELYPELGLCLTTSGSTGSPKFVRQSYTNLASNTASIVEYLGLDSSECAITTLPMNYTYGLSIINTHLEVGAKLALTETSILRGDFWEFFEQENVTSFGGVPYTYEILHKMKFTKRDTPSLRYMTQAGGKLSPELHKIFAEYAQEYGKKFIVMYGQTEATARMAYLPADKALEKYGSTGIAIPGGNLWLRDVDGNKITEPEVVGELVYEGANVTLGYAECAADLAKGDERGGRLETGDMAKFDKDGYFYVVGRLKRFLKIYGNRVNLDETERMIKKEFEGVDLACGGKDDALKVYVVGEDEEIKKSIRKFLTEKTGLNLKAFSVEFVPEIPRNEAGKIQYKLLDK